MKDESIVPPVLSEASFTGSAEEIFIPSVHHRDGMRVGYNVLSRVRNGSKYPIVKTINNATVASAEIVCVAEPTGVPNEYILQIAGRRRPVLLKLDHALKPS